MNQETAKRFHFPTQGWRTRLPWVADRKRRRNPDGVEQRQLNFLQPFQDCPLSLLEATQGSASTHSPGLEYFHPWVAKPRRTSCSRKIRRHWAQPVIDDECQTQIRIGPNQIYSAISKFNPNSEIRKQENGYLIQNQWIKL